MNLGPEPDWEGDEEKELMDEIATLKAENERLKERLKSEQFMGGEACSIAANLSLEKRQAEAERDRYRDLLEKLAAGKFESGDHAQELAADTLGGKSDTGEE